MTRVALITGSSSGIGAATARLLAERGMRVVVNYLHSAQAAEEVVADIGRAGNRCRGRLLPAPGDSEGQTAWPWVPLDGRAGQRCRPGQMETP